MPITENKCKDCGSTSRKLIQTGARTFRCVTCIRAKKRVTKTSAHTRRMQTDYNLAPGEYNELKAAQGGLCFTCGPWTGNRGLSKNLAVDHDHSCCLAPPICGKCIRGLICGPCNEIIGRVGDSQGHAIERLQALMDYLTNPPAQPLLAEIRKKKTNEQQYFGSDGIFGD